MGHCDDNALYQAASELAQNEGLAAEMAEWDGTVADGLPAETVPVEPE
jgi:hypothetical protein